MERRRLSAMSSSSVTRTGSTASSSSMKSPSWAPSSPTGCSRETVSATPRASSTLSTVTPASSAISAGRGSRPSSALRLAWAARTAARVSCRCTGMRTVRDLSAMARVIAWRIHQVA